MDLAFKISPENLIHDFCDFESWSNGNSVAPDGWSMTGTAGSVARESTEIKYGTYSMKIISGASSTYAAQYIYDFLYNNLFRDGITVSALNYLPGKTVKFGCWIKCSSANKARIYVDDGINAVNYSSYHTGGGSYEFLEVEHQIHDNSTQLKLGCQVTSATITAYFDGAVLVEGENIWTEFRANTVYVRENDFEPRVSFSVGSFVIPRRDSSKITNVLMRDRKIKLKVQIYSTTYPLCRDIFDTIVKAVSGGRKDLWFEDDRVSKVWLSNIPRLEFMANAKVYVFDLDFLSDDPHLNFISSLRQKNNISSSPTSFQIENSGTLKTFPKFFFIPPSGVTITSLTFENLTTGQRFNYSSNVAPNLSLMFDCDNLRITVNNVDGASYFSGDLMELNPGTNFMRYTGTIGITIFSDWFNRYI